MAIQSEQEIIGCIVKKNSLLNNLDLSGDEFSSELLGDVYRELASIINAGGKLDIVTLGDLWRERQPDYLQAVSTIFKSGCGSERMIDKYQSSIKTDYRKKQAVDIALSMQYSITEQGDLTSIDRAITELMKLNQSNQKYSLTLDDCILEAKNMVEVVFDSGGSVGIPTGLNGLDASLGGFHKTNLTVIGARPAMGKAQPLSSKVLLECGKFIQMADVRLGDRLASVDGKESIVDGIFPQGVRPIYELHLSDGRKVECDIEHLWNIESSRFDGVKTVTTKKLIEMLGKVRYKDRISLVTHSGEFGVDSDLGIDPWLIGFLIGDGALTGSSVRFSTGEDFILNKISKRLPEGFKINHSDRCNYRIVYEGSNNPILDELRKMGLCTRSYEKFIPEKVFSASKRIRFEFLMGLIESDGWSFDRSLQFSSSSERLSLDVQRLVRSIGGCASIRTKTNVKYVENGERMPARDAHILSICFKDMDSLIESERVSKHLGVRRKTSNPIIRSIESAGKDLAQCIHVTHPKHLYITDDYIVTHNTALLLNMVHAGSENGRPVGLISAEQGAGQIGMRMISIHGSVDSQKMQTAKFEDYEWGVFSNAITTLLGRGVMVNIEPGISITTVISQAREWRHRHNIEALYVDYIQKIRGSNPRDNKTQQVTEVVGQLKNLARELDIPVIALAQVKREVDTRPDKRPSMGDMSDASEIEKEADEIMTLYRDEVYNEDSPDAGIAEISVCKNRHGPIGVVRAEWLGRFMQFKDIETQFQGSY